MLVTYSIEKVYFVINFIIHELSFVENVTSTSKFRKLSNRKLLSKEIFIQWKIKIYLLTVELELITYRKEVKKREPENISTCKGKICHGIMYPASCTDLNLLIYQGEK